MSGKKKYARYALLFLEAASVFSIVAMLVLCLVAFRLNASPFNIGFAKSYIEHALRNPQRGTYAKMDSMQLYWPDLRGPLLLGVKNARVYDNKDQIIVSVDEADIALSKPHILIGQISPVALILKKPQLQLIRSKAGTIDIGFGRSSEVLPSSTAPRLQSQTDLATRILSYIDNPGQNSGASPLSGLRAFQIKDARLDMEDLQSGKSWFLPHVDATFKSVKKGLAVDAALDVPDPNGGVSVMRARVVMSRTDKTTDVQIRLKDFDVDIIAEKIPDFASLKEQNMKLNAQIDAVLGADMNPTGVRILATSARGDISIDEFSSKPVPYKNMVLQAIYSIDRKILDISKASITLKDVVIGAKGVLALNDNQVIGPLEIAIPDITHDQIAALWPETLKGDSSEEWIVQKITAGLFHNLKAKIDIAASNDAEQGWDVKVNDAQASFVFEKTDVNYREPLVPVANARGKGRFDYLQEKLNVDIDDAMIGDLHVTEGQLEFIHIIEPGKGVADINVKLNGPLATGMDYIAREPIGVKHKFDISKIQGNADLSVNVNFPTVHGVKVEDVKVGVQGNLTGVSLPGVVKDLPLSGGPFALSVKDNAFRLSGKGELSDRPVSIDYNEYLRSAGHDYASRVTAEITADPNLRAHMGINLDRFLEGSVPAVVTYTDYGGGRTEADIKADIGPARFFVEPFDFEKPAGVEGSATLKAVLQDGDIKEIKDLKASAPKFMLENGHVTFRGKGEQTELSGGTAPRIVIGETVGKIQFEVEPAGRYKIVMDGPFIDMQSFLNKKEQEEKPYDNPALLVSMSADRMRTGPEDVIKHGKIYADIDAMGRFNQLEMDAIAGEGDVYLRYKPDESGKRVFKFEAADAGATLKAFGVYENVRGGKISAYGEPARGDTDRNLVGQAEITNFKVVHAPTLARLLGIMSLPGIISLLESDGLEFAKLEAKFDWLYRPGGSLLKFKEGRTSGNSVGFTFDGTYDKKAGTINVGGTVVPLSGINDIIGSIPLVGDILTGGSGGVFAATYTIQGPAKEPEVFVNPLAVLAPGILRRILFE